MSSNKIYMEKEIKILNIDVSKTRNNLEKLGAKKVFDGKRVRISFDSKDKSLISSGIELRITEEGETKFSLDETNEDGTKSSIKLKISRTQEMEDILARLGIVPATRVESKRISYELGSIDFDIDIFPQIPPFIEIDLENFEGDINELLAKLELSDNEVYTGSTMDLYKKYGLDYLDLFSV